MAKKIATKDERKFAFDGYTRMLIMFLCTIYLTCLVGNSISLNFTVICMFKDVDSANSTTLEPQSMFTEGQHSWLFSIIAVGIICGTLPISSLQGHFGLRKTLAAYGLLSAIATLLLPFAVSVGFWLVLVCRFLQGFAIASSFPAIGAIVSEWGTWQHSGAYTSYLSGHLQLGPIITMPLAGELCESSWGWPLLYYAQAAVTIIVLILFVWFYRDSAADHPYVSREELELLRKDKVTIISTDKVPVREIFTDSTVLGVFACFFGATFAFQLFYQFGPLYLNKVLNFHVQSTGFGAAFPALVSFMVKIFAGPLSDHIPYLSARWRLIVFASISQFAEAICFVILALLPDGESAWAQVFFTASIGFSGLNAVGVWKATQLISGQFAYVLMAVNQFLSSLTILILPPIVTTIAPNNSREEWATLLYGTSVFIVITTMAFNLTARATPRSWAHERKTNSVV
ncbi:Vesicular glutamate transporter 2 [Aphelenchoides besseyi]|nr:Vesicular glutamate transporter 2 [Aphelenchoides besseyi]KAI6217251.1 Vesicular glutamate transporter 2 [Aphelenchoides besseyi]